MVHGDMFWQTDSGAAYEFPKGSGKNTHFASGFWLGGYQQGTSDLAVATQTYRTKGFDFWPGPLNEFNGATSSPMNFANWNQIWKINRTTIDSFLQLSNHTLVNTPPGILHWPGRLNPYSITPFNTVLNIPNREMAPFVDVNNDNVYNALDGDYPDIKGDQMLWWVFNDNTFQKTISNSDPMKVEIHASAYAYQCAELSKVTFLSFKIMNWNTIPYDSVYLGLWSDIDLGFAHDDFIGFDTLSQMAVGYNGNPYDGEYGYNLTQHGIIMTKGPKVYITPNQSVERGISSSTYFHNSNGSNGDPQTKEEFYNYLTGKWRDGKPFTFGCDPYDSNSTPFPFVFPDDPSVPNGISEVMCNHTGGDRRILLSTGPAQLKPGMDPLEITYAFFNTDTGVNNSNFNTLRHMADTVRNLYCNGIPMGINSLNHSYSIDIFPNPSHDFVYIRNEEGVQKVELFDMEGRFLAVHRSNRIDIRNLCAGMYILKVYFMKGIGVTRMVKN